MRMGIVETTLMGVFSRCARGNGETMNGAISYAAVSERNTMFSRLRQFGTKRPSSHLTCVPLVAGLPTPVALRPHSVTGQVPRQPQLRVLSTGKPIGVR